MNGGVPSRVVAVDAVISFGAGVSTVSHAFGGSFFRSRFCCYKSSLRVLGGFGNDVDYAVDGVSAPQGSPWPANDFNAVHIFEHDVLHVPVNAREKRGVDAPAIDQNEQLVVEAAVESSGTDGPLVLINAGHFQTRNHAQGFGNAGRPGTADILLGDDEDRCRRVGHLLWPLGDRYVHQVFQTQFGGVIGDTLRATGT